ncbi:MAG: type II toxin-antitoxin system VapC family toxin [Nitrospirae bacterium]|nr:type II toxin-antitoxin system VapC family toxin [Nitrospirota bacterium]
MIYFDSSYIVRLYFKDAGFEAVRELAATATIVCAEHGRVEFVSALHRKRREGVLSPDRHSITIGEFVRESRVGAFRWLPLTPAVFARVENVFKALASTVPLRAADAMHLACAAQNGFTQVYSNNRVLLAAATLFALKGVDVLAG